MTLDEGLTFLEVFPQLEDFLREFAEQVMYDIIFISYNEAQADDSWKTLKDRFPYAKRIHGVKGIHQAHIEAAKNAVTDMLWIVDADAIVLDSFDFSYIPDITNQDTVHVYTSINPINGLEYGNGGVKLFPD